MTDIVPVEPVNLPPAFVPRIDVLQIEGAFVIRVAVPGVFEEDIDLSFDTGGIIVRGELQQPPIADEARAIVREWTYGRFERRIELPSAAQRESMSVEVEFGVLELRFPMGG